MQVNAEQTYKHAYDLHYKKKDFEGALSAYLDVIEHSPETQECGYAKTQIDNIIGSGADFSAMTGVVNRYNQLIGNFSERLESTLNAKAAEVQRFRAIGEEADQTAKFKAEQENCMGYIKANIVDFPMMTISQVPPGAQCRIKAMVTANATVGTGLFSELSQGFSDMFGMTNTTSGMALKVNSGEATVRAIIANKAVAMGANCVIGVDIDYGVTNNNAATVNMQGTAVLISNLNEILDDAEFAKAQKIEAAYARIKELDRWLRGEFSAD
jgi:uncharacterized protein YbjQ (UPF0145 family)